MKKFYLIPVAILGVVLMAAVFAYSAFLTVDLSTRIFPGRVLEPFLSLALFDMGAVVWFLVFMWGSEGLAQRAIAMLMFILSFFGMSITSLGDLYLGGQEIAAVSSFWEVGSLMIMMYWLWSAIHTLAGFAFIATHPTVSDQIWRAIHADTITDRARAEARQQVEKTSTALAPAVGYKAHDRIMRGEGADYTKLMQEAYAGGGQTRDEAHPDPRDAEIARLKRELAQARNGHAKPIPEQAERGASERGGDRPKAGRPE